MHETMNDDETQPSSEELADRLASADPADAPAIAEQLAERLENDLDRSAEDRRAPATEDRTEGPNH